MERESNLQQEDCPMRDEESFEGESGCYRTFSQDDVPINELFNQKTNTAEVEMTHVPMTHGMTHNEQQNSTEEVPIIKQDSAELSLQCAICPSFFSTLEDLEIHFKEHETQGYLVQTNSSEIVDQTEEEEELRCPECSLLFSKFKNLQSFEKHMKRHEAEKSFFKLKDISLADRAKIILDQASLKNYTITIRKYVREKYPQAAVYFDKEGWDGCPISSKNVYEWTKMFLDTGSLRSPKQCGDIRKSFTRSTYETKFKHFKKFYEDYMRTHPHMKEPSHKDMAKACNLNHKTVANYMKRIHYEEFGFPLGISNGKVYKPPQGAIHAALDQCTVKNDKQQKQSQFQMPVQQLNITNPST
jgi:uncharacterized C2H2 Zn-finger protein